MNVLYNTKIDYTLLLIMFMGGLSLFFAVFKFKANVSLSIGSRIAYGSRAQREDFPHLAQITIYLEVNNYCSASLISAGYVLTAAHCLVSSLFIDITKAGVLTIKLGSENRLETSRFDQEMLYYNRQKNIIMHPDFSLKTFRNDIALIKLPTSIQFNKYLMPIKLASALSYPDYYTGLTANISGWGKPFLFMSCSSHLRYYPVKIKSQDYCLTQIKPGAFKYEFICASGFHQICVGDSGGPLVVDGIQIGLATATAGLVRLCGFYVTSVFLPVSAYRYWINENSDVRLS